jgi:hypothetical protein
MATLKRLIPPASAPAPPDPSPLDWILSGLRPGTADARDAVWLAVRSDLAVRALGGPFDPRHVLRLEGVALREWYAARRAWAVEQFRDDARVVIP